MQRLVIEAATQASGLAISRALDAFHPELEIDDGAGRCLVTVRIGDARRASDVFATLAEFLKTRLPDTAKSMTLTVDYQIPVLSPHLVSVLGTRFRAAPDGYTSDENPTIRQGEMRGPEPAPLQLRLQAQPERAAGLRRRIRIWLGEHGATEDEIFAVLTAVSEAFVNAVEHPQNPALDRIDVDGTVVHGLLTLEIHDSGAWQHRRLRPGGNGYPLMRGLMDAVEVERRPSGSTVTMRKRLTGRAPAGRVVAERAGHTTASRGRKTPARARPPRSDVRARRWRR